MSDELLETQATTKPGDDNFQNQIDKEFGYLMDYIKGRSLAQMKDAIIRNLRYFKETDPANYIASIDYYNKYDYLWGKIKPESGIYELADNRAQTLVEHRQDFEWLYGRLGDYRSKKVLLVILSFWLSSNYKPIAEIQEKLFHQYFDFDLVRCNKDEIFVDIGAYIGDTMVDYVKMYGADCYKKIYCYEILQENIDYIKKNEELFKLKNVIVNKKGVSNKSGFLYTSGDAVSSVCTLSEEGSIKVPAVTLDEDVDEPVTFIKMDIEGGEEDALLGCRKKIQENHPKLALSVYHNHKDLWKLARIIEEFDPSYRFYLRYYGYPLVPTEYLLYAI
jgi:FkbM family methyltransferase